MTCCFFLCWNLCSGACLTQVLSSFHHYVVTCHTENVKTSNPSAFLPASFSLTFLLSVSLVFSLWIVMFYSTLTNAHPCCEAGYWKIDAAMAALQSIQEVNFGMPPRCVSEKSASKSEAAELCELGAERESPCSKRPPGLFSADLKTRTSHTEHAHGCSSRFLVMCVLQVIVNTFQHQ